MRIIGTGSALPQKVVSNDELSQYLDTSDEWIYPRTGIRERRMTTTESLYDLAVDACNKAIEAAKIDPKDLDYIICSNVANIFVTPGMGCILQGKIGATCPSYDINQACAGFIFALNMAEAFFKTGTAKNILIVCAEEPSKFCDWSERDAAVLFGDGAGAVVVTAGDDLKAMRLTTTSMYDVLYYQRDLEKTPFEQFDLEHKPLVMKGRDVFKMAVKTSADDMKHVIEEAGLEVKDINMFLFHQANARIIEAIRQRLGAEDSYFPTNLERYGNTSSASIVILLDEMLRRNEIKQGDYLVMSAFGAGFVSAACVLKWWC